MRIFMDAVERLVSSVYRRHRGGKLFPRVTVPTNLDRKVVGFCFVMAGTCFAAAALLLWSPGLAIVTALLFAAASLTEKPERDRGRKSERDP